MLARQHFASMLAMVWGVLLLSACPGAVVARVDALANVAAAAEGGVAVALFSQDTFEAALAIDGELGSARGWAYYGQVEMAKVIFAFDSAYEVSRVRIVSGYGMADHHITAFQLWAYYPPGLVPAPPAEAGPASSTSSSVISSAIRQREESESATLRMRLAEAATFLSQVEGPVPETIASELPFSDPGWMLVRGVQRAGTCAAELEQGVSGNVMVKAAPVRPWSNMSTSPQSEIPRLQIMRNTELIPCRRLLVTSKWKSRQHAPWQSS